MCSMPSDDPRRRYVCWYWKVSSLPAVRIGLTLVAMSVRIVYWESDGYWVGYLEEFPDYWTQGETFEDLQEHLRDLYRDLMRIDPSRR